MSESRHPGGRPTVMTPEVITKLEQAFSLDASVEEACFYAGISRSPFYAYLEDHPEFKDRIEQLRLKPVLAARQTVVSKATESYGNAMDYLKRKRRKEFGENLDITTDLEKRDEVAAEVARLAKEFDEWRKLQLKGPRE